MSIFITCPCPVVMAYASSLTLLAACQLMTQGLQWADLPSGSANGCRQHMQVFTLLPRGTMSSVRLTVDLCT